MRRVVETLLTLAFTVTIPAAAWAQATIAGEVRDTSGGVLPGVAVEAASPALIEKVRTATTDSNGRYRIEDLRPGTYTVAFTLPGFATTRREQPLHVQHAEAKVLCCCGVEAPVIGLVEPADNLSAAIEHATVAA